MGLLTQGRKPCHVLLAEMEVSPGLGQDSAERGEVWGTSVLFAELSPQFHCHITQNRPPQQGNYFIHFSQVRGRVRTSKVLIGRVQMEKLLLKIPIYTLALVMFHLKPQRGCPEL